MTTIRPDLIAGKIEAMQRGEIDTAQCPLALDQLRELLWFIQALSMQPRGLESLSADLVKLYADRFVSDSMKKAGPPEDGRYSLDQCLAIWKAIDRKSSNSFDRQTSLLADRSRRIRMHSFYGDDRPFEEETKRERCNSEKFNDWLSYNVDSRITVQAVEKQGGSYSKENILDGLGRFNWPFLQGRCLDAGREHLVADLADACVNKSHAFRVPWYCPELLTLLCDYMDHYAAQRRQAIAQTEITKIVFRKLEFARTQGVPVQLLGDSRLGKSSSASAYCEMRPGLARLVTVPSGNSMRDFIAAHADAFGIDYTPGTTLAALATLVKYVHRHSQLFICYDESHNLIPANFHKTTPPARLNFVRSEVIDRNLSCAFFATPQSHRQTLDQYVKTTGYRIEQWLGRIAPAVILPMNLPRQDMLAVANLNFPDFSEPFLKLIAAKAMQSEGYLKNLEMTAKCARFIAKENGHEKLTLEDVLAAIQEMMPDTIAAVMRQQPASDPAATPPPIRRARSATPPPAAVELTAAPGSNEDLSVRSLESSRRSLSGGIKLHVAGE